MSFNSLGLSADLLATLNEQGYETPTPVQTQAIPAVLAGSDVMVSAQTGTGKTAAFTLPVLERLRKKPQGQNKHTLRALILTPTRELAAQVGDCVKIYGKNTALKSTIVFGGVNINPQMRSLRQGCDILIATPGRLLDHVEQGTVNLSKIDILVLDEADRMLDMGFIHDLRRIIDLLPATRQNLMFSATFSDPIKKLANGLMKAPKIIEVSRSNTVVESITQLIYPVDNKRKRALLSYLIASEKWGQVLVFTRTKHCANKLSQQLETDGISSTAIHGNKSQSARTKALSDFKRGSIQVLVATDIAARGLDIDQLPHVVNFELPHCPEDYVHRIGRTGRAGNVGAAVSLVCIDEHKLLKDIERMLKSNIPKIVVPGYEPDPTIKAEPILRGRMQNQGNSQRPGQRPRMQRNRNKNHRPRNKSN